MAITQTQQLPAPFLQDISKDYATRLGQVTAPKLETGEFAPKVAPQDPYQTTAYGRVPGGIGAYQPTSLAQAQQVLHRAQHRWGKQQQRH